MATAEVRKVERQGAPGTDTAVDYELGAEIDGAWLVFQRLGEQDLEQARAAGQPSGGSSSGSDEAAAGLAEENVIPQPSA